MHTIRIAIFFFWFLFLWELRDRLVRKKRTTNYLPKRASGALSMIGVNYLIKKLISSHYIYQLLEFLSLFFDSSPSRKLVADNSFEVSRRRTNTMRTI